MIINGKLRDFACNVIAKGQITLGDVRRLQRGYLPGGITNREEFEILISLNAKLLRADKAWAQWLISVVADFVTTPEASGCPFEDAAGKWVERMLAASTTKLGLRIARQIRRELSRLRATQSTTGEGVQTCDVHQPRQVGMTDNPGDCSLRNNPEAETQCSEADKIRASSRPPRRNGPREMIARTTALAGAAYGWRLAIQRSDLINFQSSRISLVLAPCL
jgi:hypothetical protein